MSEKKERKQKKTGLGLACWILAFLILIIVFLVKQDDIFASLKATNFFERMGGKTPEFVEKHEEKKKPQEKDAPVLEDTVITLNTKSESRPVLQPEKKTEIIETKEPEKEEKKAAGLAEKNSQTAKDLDEKKESAKSEKSEKATEDKKEAKNSAENTKTADLAKAKSDKSTVPTPVTNAKICFVEVFGDGTFARKIMTRKVVKNDSPLTNSINALISGPNQQEKSKGCMSLLPDGTRLLSATVHDGVAYLNFSEEFEFNRLGVVGLRAQLEQVVFTATQFSTVKSVQFMIEGDKKEYLGSEGVWIGTPLSQSAFN